MPKKYREEYQPLNEFGDPIGPPQVAEGDTKDELIAILKANHMNASAAYYKERRANKLGILMEPDPEQPIQSFEEKPLTADERVRIANALKDPAQAVDATRTLIESMFGASLENVRANLREIEIQKRRDFIASSVEAFKGDHPEYVVCRSNQEAMLTYLTKRNWPITKKNLELAYNNLVEEGDVLVLQAKRETAESTPAAEATTVTETATTVDGDNGTTDKTTTPISEESTVVRPSQSSSGLRRSDSSVSSTTTTSKVGEITLSEVNAMTSEQYIKALNERPGFKEAVEKLYADLKK